jgi:HEAT repeat protein
MNTRDVKPRSKDEELAAIVARFASEPEGARHALREWHEEDPPGFTLLAVRQLGRNPDSPATGILSALLSRDQLYLFYLTDPAEFTHQEASNVARVLSARDKRFYVKLTDFSGDSLSDDRVTRVLQIAEALGAAGLMVPWLRRMTKHPDGFIRQKAVMIMCQTGSNPLLVERQLRSPDPRVRANAVESLWTVATPAARGLLEYATQDVHHRVALNALVGLFMQGDANAMERMKIHASQGTPAFRIAAAWALGLTGKAEAWHTLDALRHDPVEQVRESAIRALEKVPKPSPEARPETVPQQTAGPQEAVLNIPQFRLVP